MGIEVEGVVMPKIGRRLKSVRERLGDVTEEEAPKML